MAEREIKFRCWDSKEKKMIYDIQDEFYCCECACEYSGGSCDDGDSYFGVYLDDERYEVEQYTGLKDKNGKCLYKGDIVEFPVDDGMLRIVRGIVMYDAPSFYMDYRQAAPRLHSGCMVLGNIHENPELLDCKEGE